VDPLDDRRSNLGQQLTAVATVTLEDVQKVSRPFVEGDSNGSAYEELVLAIERKLRSLIKRPKKHEKHDRYKSIAILVKILTQGRTVDQARDYLKSKENANFRKC
jgi:hypothetical protein